MKKYVISLLFGFTLFFNSIFVYGATLIPSGESVGIKLNYDGILITGGFDIKINNENYNPLNNGISTNDKITKINGDVVTTIDSLSKIIKSNINNNIDNILTIESSDLEYNHKLIVQVDGYDYNTGLYVKDSIVGIGTMTYYNPETNSFGSLGHSIIDIESSQELITSGELYESSVTGLVKGTTSNTGQKIANVNNIKLGDINDHTNYGIYGVSTNQTFDLNETMETANFEEIELGRAYFMTVLNNQTVEKCYINITKLNPQDKIDTKGIEFTVIDTDVINQTNGIIQGMSGSPIIQNNKIIGCVTHVSSNNPSKGYGLFIEWMLEIDSNN